MSLQNYLLSIVTVLALSVGQILFKLAARGLGGDGPMLQQIMANHFLWMALFVYALATGMWVALLRQMPLNVAYPFVALAYFLVPVLGHFFLHEVLRWQSLVGALVIILGVWISVGLK